MPPFPAPAPRKVHASGGGLSANTIGGIVVLVLVVGGGGFFAMKRADGERCSKFNDAVVKACGRMETLTQGMQPQLAAWQVGNPVDPADLRAGYQQCLTTLEAAERELGAVDVPDRASARAFLEKAKAFVAMERELTEKDLKKLVDLLCDANATRVKVAAEMMKVAGPIMEREQAMAAEMRAAQQAFAKDVGMELR